jgi:glycosyltransferase involved in cell wall biosynthesis
MMSADMSGRGVAVSVSTLPLEADSRAYRMARTLAEAGFQSIVVEAQASSRQFWGGGIEVRPAGPKASETKPNAVFQPGRLRDAVTAVRQGRFGTIGKAGLYAGYRLFDWQRHCYRPRPLIPPAELYVLHSFEMYRAVAPIALRLGARILYDAHDFYREIDPPERQSPFDRTWRQPFLQRLEDRLVANADLMTTVGTGIADLMARKLGRRPDVIRNCHDDRLDRQDAVPLRRVLGLGDSCRLAVVVGNYKAGLAIHTAAAAVERLPDDWHLAFLGRGYEVVAAELPPALIGRRVHIGHVVAPDEVVPMIRAADLGLVLYEPFSDNYRYALPNGFFQVIAAGLPLVRGELPEIEATIGDARIGYSLTRLEPEALARAMLRCVEDRDALRGQVAALARSLRWEEEALRLRRLIETARAPTAASRLAPLRAAS